VLTEAGWPIAPSTVRAWRSRPVSSRRRRDEELAGHIARVRKENYGVFGARKVWLTLNREGIPVARCTVERLVHHLLAPYWPPASRAQADTPCTSHTLAAALDGAQPLAALRADRWRDAFGAGFAQGDQQVGDHARCRRPAVGQHGWLIQLDGT
jgi:hypothetical protein